MTYKLKPLKKLSDIGSSPLTTGVVSPSLLRPRPHKRRLLIRSPMVSLWQSNYHILSSSLTRPFALCPLTGLAIDIAGRTHLTHFKFELLLCPSRATFHLTSKHSEGTAVTVVQWQYPNSQILLGVHGQTGNSTFLRTTVRMNVSFVRNSALSVERQVFRFSPVNALPEQISTRLTW